MHLFKLKHIFKNLPDFPFFLQVFYVNKNVNAFSDCSDYV